MFSLIFPPCASNEAFYFQKRPRMLVGRGPVPRHAAIAGDRPPRYGEKTPLHRRARACPSPCSDRGGNPLGCACGIRGPPRYVTKQAHLSVGRGPVPRHAPLAGDRPPRYGEKTPLHRRARACPSPCSDRGGNPLGCACGIRGPPRYVTKQDKIRSKIETRRSRLPFRRARACPSPCYLTPWRE